MEFDLAEVADALEGELIGSSVSFDGAAIDSRGLKAGTLFVALTSDRDGHDFVADAAGRGAAAALVERRVPAELPQVVVDDTARGLARLGRLARARLGGAVIGITGSVGKTTTKDLLAAIAARAGSAAASERSLNNELGVPLTLAAAPESADRVVVEMGARGAGHIRELCEIARPTVGVVTVVAAAHTEHFGGVDAIAVAKGELIEALPSDGLAVLNADDPRVAAMASRSSARVVTFGDRGDVRAVGVELDESLRPRFELRSPWGAVAVRVGASGRHHIANALAAATAALGTGVGLDDVAAGLAEAHLSPWRMEIRTTSRGGRVINDAYNANPTSMRAAIDSLVGLAADRRVAVLGEMAELGPDAAEEHRSVADYAAERGVEILAVATDLYGEPWCEDVDAAGAQLGEPGSGVAVLVKGSRVAGLERLAERWCGAGQV